MHAQPWQALETLLWVDTEKLRQSHKILRMTDRVARIKTLHCNIVAQRLPRDLVPVFDVVAFVIQENLARELASKYGYYRQDNPAAYSEKMAKVSQQLSAWSRQIPSLTNEKEVVKDCITWLLKKGLISKTQQFLASATYVKAYEAPNELALFEASGLLVGAAGWQAMGTNQNIVKVLRFATLHLRYGREKQVLEFGSFLTPLPGR